MRYLTNELACPTLGLLRSLLGSLIVLALPPGAGTALIGLATALAWRLPALFPGLTRTPASRSATACRTA